MELIVLSLSINATDITDNITSFVNCETSVGFYGGHGDGGWFHMHNM